METGTDLSVVNLGSEEMVRMVDVAEQIIQLTHSTSKIVFEKPLIFLTKKGVPDLQRAKDEMGWIPLVRLQDGLKKTIDYTLANKEAMGLQM